MYVNIQRIYCEEMNDLPKFVDSRNLFLNRENRHIFEIRPFIADRFRTELTLIRTNTRCGIKYSN